MRTALTLSLLLASTAARAQPATGDVTAAAAAFQEGQRAQIAGDYARAAEFFELADHAAPSPAALRSAIRNHQAAGHATLAATLAFRAHTRDAADAQSAQLADAVLAELSPRLARVHLVCEPACTVSVDQLAVAPHADASHTFFLDPGSRALDVRWSGRGNRTRSLDAAAGQQVELQLDAPPPEAPPAPTVTPPVVAPVTPPRETRQPPPPPPPSGWSPAVFWVGVGLTAVSAGLLVWSGVDTLSARDAYVAAPTEAGYNDGVGRETRTNVFIGTTAALGVATAVVGVFATRWRSTSEVPYALRPTLRLGAAGSPWGVGVLGSF